MRGHPLTYPLCVTIGALASCLAWAPFGDSEQVSMLVTVALIIACYSGFRLLKAFGPVRGVRGAVPVGRVRQQHRLLSRSWLEVETGDGRRWLPVYFDPALVTLPATTAEFGRRRVEVRTSGQPGAIETGRSEPGETEPTAPEDPETGETELTASAETGRAHAGEKDATDSESRTGTSAADRLRVYPSGPLRDSEPIGRLHDNPSRPDPDGAERATAAARPRRRLLLDAQSVVAAPILGLLWVATGGGGIPAFAGATVVAATTAVWFSAVRGSDPS